MRSGILTLLMTLAAVGPTLARAQSRDEKVRADRKKVESQGFWIYHDLEKAKQRARASGKPILVVLRCIPCEECVKLDDELVDQHPVIRPLLEKYECVRLVATNGLDLNLFQFDTDQSFAVFLLNADGAIYGRFGTRSHRTDWNGDVSLNGLAAALRGGLELHSGYPANREQLAGKIGPKPEFPRPEKYPELDNRFGPELDYSGQVAKSCIHCHQIGDAQRSYYRQRGEAFPEKLLFPFPHPKALGLIIDPDTRATVSRVIPNSLAAEAGFRSGDEILAMNQQPLLSIADIQWVLHNTPASGGKVSARVRRAGTERTIGWPLPSGWRQLDDLSWRVSSWGLRRMTTGGLVLEPASPEQRNQLKVAENQMALRVTHVGQYGKHAAGKRAGFRRHDIVLSVDGRDDLLREADWFRHALAKAPAGKRLEVEVARGGRRMTFRLPMQQ